MSINTLISLQKLLVVTNSTASVVQVGDRYFTYLYNQGMSIKKNIADYGMDEPEFENYRMFIDPVPALDYLLPQSKIEHAMHGNLVHFGNQPPSIEVDRLRVISNSQASNIQIGNSHQLKAENRQKVFFQRVLKTKKGC